MIACKKEGNRLKKRPLFDELRNDCPVLRAAIQSCHDWHTSDLVQIFLFETLLFEVKNASSVNSLYIKKYLVTCHLIFEIVL